MQENQTDLPACQMCKDQGKCETYINPKPKSVTTQERHTVAHIVFSPIKEEKRTNVNALNLLGLASSSFTISAYGGLCTNMSELSPEISVLCDLG